MSFMNGRTVERAYVDDVRDALLQTVVLLFSQAEEICVDVCSVRNNLGVKTLGLCKLAQCKGLDEPRARVFM